MPQNTNPTHSSFWTGVTQWIGPHDEEAAFEEVKVEGYPEWKLTVITRDQGRIIFEVDLQISLDREAQRYVPTHPLWKKEIRPLILWVMQELLIRIKIVDAEYGAEREVNCGIKDPKRGSFSGIIHVRKNVNQPGVTWINVVNYVNTHIWDLLEKFISSNPDAAPSLEEMEEIKRMFYSKRHATKIERQERQKLARGSRKRGTLALSIFVDESGDTGFKRDGEYVSIAVFVPTARVDRIRAALSQVLEMCWSGQKAPAELHFSDIPIKKRQRVVTYMRLIMAVMGCRALVYIAPKMAFLKRLSRSEAEHNLGREQPSEINWDSLLTANKTAASNWLLAYLLDETISHIVIENLDTINDVTVTYDMKRYPWQDEAMHKGAETARETITEYVQEIFGEDDIPAMNFRACSSENEPCLWLADWIGWEIQRALKSVNGELDTSFISVLKVIDVLIVDDNGIKASVDLETGKRLGDYPDWPRNIAPYSQSPDRSPTRFLLVKLTE